MTVITDNTSTSRTPQRNVTLPKHLRHLFIGKSLLKKHYILEAVDHFKTAIKFDPTLFTDVLILFYKRLISDYDNHDLRIIIAEFYCAHDQYKDAVQELEEIFELNPFYLPLYTLLSKIYHKSGQKLTVLHFFESAIQYEIFEPAIIDLLSNIYLKESNIDKSIALYQRLIAKLPENHSYYKILAELFIRKRDFERAAQIYNDLLEKAPYTAQELITPLHQLVQLSPRNPIVRQTVILVHLRSLQPLETVFHINELIRYTPRYLPTAIQLLKRSLDQFPNTFEILIALSEALYELDHYSECLDYLQLIFDTFPDHSEDLIPIIKKILKKQPLHYQASLLFGDIYCSQQNYQKGLHYFQSLIPLSYTDLNAIETRLEVLPDDLCSTDADYATLILARLKYCQEKYQESLMLCDTLLDSQETLHAHLLKADIYAKQRQFKSSLAVLFSILTTTPHYWETHETIQNIQRLNLKHSLIKTQKTASVYANADQPHMDIAHYHLLLQNYYQAIETLQSLLSHSPECITGHLLLARSFMEFGRSDLSINQFQQLLNNYFDDLQRHHLLHIHYMLGLNNLLVGQLSTGLHHFERVFQQDVHFRNITSVVSSIKDQLHFEFRAKGVSGCFSAPQDSSLWTQYIHNQEDPHTSKSSRQGHQTLSFSFSHNNLGVDHLLQRNTNAAIESLKLSIQMDPKLTISYANLAFAYLMQNNVDKAFYYIDQAISIHKELDIIYLTRGLAYFTQKSYDKAVQSFKKALTYTPSLSLAYLNIGDVYYTMKNSEQATHYWKEAAKDPQLFLLIQRRSRYLMKTPLDTTYWIDHLEHHLNIPCT